MPLPPTFRATLASAKMLSPQVRELVFERTDGAPCDFDAGQWLNIMIPSSDGEIKRSYSIASPPSASSRFEITLTLVEGGPGSTFLHTINEGTELTFQGPQGFFTRTRTPNTPSLFIGTGTGITPLRSMIIDALQKGEKSPFVLIYGVRNEEDLLYRDEFEGLSKKYPHVQVIHTLSRPHGTWNGKSGYVQTHVREAWSELAKTAPPHAYICGLEKMVSAVRHLLRTEMGVERTQVHTERYD